jgi:hypothetical protein
VTVETHASRGDPGSAAPRRRRWLRWLLATVAVVAVLLVGAIVFYVNLPAPARLALPATAAAPTGALDGHWVVGDGSAAGFRLTESILGLGHDVVGRTTQVTGSAEVTGSIVTGATFQIDLASITNEGEPMPQLSISLETGRYPTAVVTLAEPIALPESFATGDGYEVTTTADVEVHGTTHRVPVSMAIRRDGATVVAAGSMSVALADWGIVGPEDYGLLGSLSDVGLAEFLVVLRPE